MDSGYYAACTALMARTQALDLVANNLANTSTPGYRAQHNIFRSLLASSGHPESAVNQAINNFGILGGSQLDLSQGNLEKTGNDLDLGIEGQGFFVVQTAAGRVFTRNGNFHVSPEGKLLTSEGDPVMGDQGTIQVVGGGQVSVSPDGTISVNGALAGKLKLVEFPAGTAIESVGKTYYSAPPKADKAAVNSRIQQGTLESSNVNPVASAVELVEVQRYAELVQRALSTFNSDINKVATEELPRVSG